MASAYQPGTRISEYVLDARLGSGSFGEVWRARHHIWNTDHVAIKLPTEPQYVRYLQREGAVVHGLRHPNVIRVLGLDPYAEIPYLVMELVRGPAVAGVLEEHRKGLPIDAVHTILRGVLDGLNAAHTAGVLHRDLKPGNVMLDLDGKPLAELRSEQVKIGDFGLGMTSSDTLRSIAQSASIERDGKLVGTLAYMAPELRDGAGRPDARSDLFSLGVMLFEMICGERPAGAELPTSLRADCPRHLDAIYQRLYARHDRRYESAEAVLKDLAGAMPGRLPPVPGAAAGAPSSNGHLRFEYEAVDTSGIKRFGEISAVSRDDALVRVRGMGMFPTQLRDISAAGPACRQCRKPIQPGDQYCMSCGVQLVGQVRRCGACGSFPSAHDQFCIFCGQALAAPAGA